MPRPTRPPNVPRSTRASPWAGWLPRTRSLRPLPTWPARSRAPPPAWPWPWMAACRACGSGRGRADGPGWPAGTHDFPRGARRSLFPAATALPDPSARWGRPGDRPLDGDGGGVAAGGDGLAHLETEPGDGMLGEQAPGDALGGGLDEAELPRAHHGGDRFRHGGIVERVGQVVSRGGRTHVGGFRDHVHAEDQGLLDLAFPVMHADDRRDAEVFDGYVVRHGTEASHCSTPAMCTVAQDLATSGSWAASASRMARCSASVRARAPVWVSPRQTRARVVGPDIDSSSEASTEFPEQATIRRWNSRSLATRSSAAGSGPMLSSRVRRPSHSSLVIRSAAIAVAAGSRMRRTRRNSSSVSSRWKSTMKLSASSSRRGSRLVTYVPSPRRTSRMFTRDSARTASRSELRESPSSAARSASRGSRSPARSAPEVIMPLIFSMASSVTATGRGPPP